MAEPRRRIPLRMAGLLLLGTLAGRLEGSPARAAAEAPPPPPRAAVPVPMMVQIRRALEAQGRAIADLEARVRAVRDDRTAFSLQTEIERVKRETRIEVLRIQAGQARREGRLGTAQELEAAIARLGAPRPPQSVAPRPQTDAGARPTPR